MPYSIRRPLTLTERNTVGGASDIVAHLLFHRGITDKENADRFLIPDYEAHIHDPFLLKDAEKAAERIIQAMKKDERIAIYADYDADGIPGATVWHDFFKRIGYANFSVYIPHRHDEGFGMNIDAVDQLKSEDVRLIVTVDCGTSDVEPVKRANESGIDVIITDHHEPPLELPPAFAIVNHKQIGCEYPDKNICGSGVAFKLIQAIIKKANELGGEFLSKMHSVGFKDGHEKWLLDLVGMATLSDMVPLVGENRVFARYGLAVLRKSPRKGIVRLLQKLKIAQKHVTEDDIAFMITPRINAASRMGVPMDAFRLLSAETDEEADVYAEHLNLINNERKGTVAALVKEVKKKITDRFGNGQVSITNDQMKTQGNFPSVIVLGNPDWRPSLLGLAANSCAEEFNRPVFLWGRDGDGIIKGSCRSGGTVSVVNIMRKVPAGVLLQYGGHFASGGFAVSNEAIHHFDSHLNSAFDLLAQEPQEIAAKYIDMEILLDEVNWDMSREIERLAPFGVGNPKPVFLFKKVAPSAVKRFGKGNEHVELVFNKNSGEKIPAISFFGVENDWAKTIQVGQPVDLIASIERSMFRGRAELRLRVVEVVTESVIM